MAHIKPSTLPRNCQKCYQFSQKLKAFFIYTEKSYKKWQQIQNIIDSHKSMTQIVANIWLREKGLTINQNIYGILVNI